MAAHECKSLFLCTSIALVASFDVMLPIGRSNSSTSTVAWLHILAHRHRHGDGDYPAAPACWPMFNVQCYTHRMFD